MDLPFFKNIRNEIIYYLKLAQCNIHIAMAWFTNDELFETLLECLDNGINVNLILMDDVINHADIGVDFNCFIAKGGKLHLFPQKIKMMHNKFCVIDTHYTITGSYNWTNYAEARNFENIIVTDNKNIANQYLKYFSDLLIYTSKTDNFDRIHLKDLGDDAYSSRFDELYEEARSLPESKKKTDYITALENRKQLFHNKYTVTTNSYSLNKYEPIINVIKDHQHPTSKYNIGFKAYLRDKETIGLKTLIKKGTELPCTVSRDAWTNNDNVSEIECELYFGETEELNLCKKFANLKLIDIPQLKSGDVKFKTNITFDTNGYIRVEFICVNTGKGEDAVSINSDYVEYK